MKKFFTLLCLIFISFDGNTSNQNIELNVSDSLKLDDVWQEAITHPQTLITIQGRHEITKELRVPSNVHITLKAIGETFLLRGKDFDGHLFAVEKEGALKLLTEKIQPEVDFRFIINGDGENQFVQGIDGTEVYLDQTVPIQHEERKEYYCTYDGKSEKHYINKTRQHYVISDDGRKLYIDGKKRTLRVEQNEKKVYIDEELNLFTINQTCQKTLLNISSFADEKNQRIVKDIVVKRDVTGCIIKNEGLLEIGGNIILCNNFNLPNLINFDCKYDGLCHGAVYNAGTFYMLEGYIGWNEGSGVFNARSGIFHMHGGAIFKNFSYHGGGVINLGEFFIHGGKISTNRAYFNGGGIYADGVFEMCGGIISGNETDFSDINSDERSSGGAVYIDQNGNMTMHDGLIARNFSKNGGGIYSCGKLTLKKGTVTENAALAIYYVPCNYIFPNIFTQQDVDKGYKIYELSGSVYGNGGGVFSNTKDVDIHKLNVYIKYNLAKHKGVSDICTRQDFERINQEYIIKLELKI